LNPSDSSLTLVSGSGFAGPGSICARYGLPSGFVAAGLMIVLSRIPMGVAISAFGNGMHNGIVGRRLLSDVTR
jgi:hypothetical protein